MFSWTSCSSLEQDGGEEIEYWYLSHVCETLFSYIIILDQQKVSCYYKDYLSVVKVYLLSSEGVKRSSYLGSQTIEKIKSTSWSHTLLSGNLINSFAHDFVYLETWLEG